MPLNECPLSLDCRHTSALLDKISGFMDADCLHGTAFPLIRDQSVACAEASVDGA
jgi:hypothetical protein